MTREEYIAEHGDSNRDLYDDDVGLKTCAECGEPIRGDCLTSGLPDRAYLHKGCQKAYSLKDKQSMIEWVCLFCRDNNEGIDLVRYIWDLIDIPGMDAEKVFNAAVGEHIDEYTEWYYSNWIECDARDGDCCADV